MTQDRRPLILDCTLRDGGYYNSWDFDQDLINEYLFACNAAQIDIVEIGFRFAANDGFKGAAAYSTDEYINQLKVPVGLKLAVMVNGSDLADPLLQEQVLEKLFPVQRSESRVEIVRLACHNYEVTSVIASADWLASRGYIVGVNLMQISEQSAADIEMFSKACGDHAVEVLYIADSMGSMEPEDIARTIQIIRRNWSGPIGIHTHDNMGLALSNTMRGLREGATWLDATVTGMGRGPGNARIEELVTEIEPIRDRRVNLLPLLTLIRKHFSEAKVQYGWGTNIYYFLAGKYGIHPTYIQEMLRDNRYRDEDMISVIQHLRLNGGKKFDINKLYNARTHCADSCEGSWTPSSALTGGDVLLLGTGPGVERHRAAIETFVKRNKPIVIALNTQTAFETDLIDYRAACHPVRLLADADIHKRLAQPLITSKLLLPDETLELLEGKEILDFGMKVEPKSFRFDKTGCIVPCSLVLAYSLAIATSGNANRVLLAGFDGYPGDDDRNQETAEVLDLYRETPGALDLVSITPTRHKVRTLSVYGLQR